MCPLRARRTSSWRHAPLGLILCLWTASAFAQVADDPNRRIAQLKVQAIEIHRLSSTGELDARTYNIRRRLIEDELKPLLEQLNRLSPQERREAETRIEEWKRTIVAVHQAQSETRGKQPAPQKRQGQQKAQPVAVAVGDSFDADVRAAVELRHRRLVLQQQRMRGGISEAEFAAQDKKALGQIMAIRGKYLRRGQSDWQSFNLELETKTWTDPKNPPPQPPGGSGGTTPADYQRDVALAAKLMVQRKELSNRPSIRNEMNGLTLAEADRPLLREWMLLREKWHAEGSGREFDLEIGQRSGLPVMPMPFATASTTPLVNPLRMPPSRVWRVVMQVITGLMILIPLGVLYALYRVFPRGKKEPGDRRSVLWYAPLVLVVWLWTGLVGYWPYQEAPYGVVMVDEHGVLAICATFVLYLFYRRSRKKDAQPARLKSIFWFAPASVVLWVWAAPVAYLPAEAAAAIVARRVFVTLAVAAGLYILTHLSRRRVPQERARSTVFGTAHYAPLQTKIEDEDCLAKGLFLGKSSEPVPGVAPPDAPGAPVCSTPEHHALIVARTRTGKGTRVIIPTLLRYGGSALVIDPKGENAAITATARKTQLQQNIHILNPWSVLAGVYQLRGFKPATYNPLDILDRNDPNAVAIALTLAGAICPLTPGSKDSFWQGYAANVLTAVFLWLADQPEEKKTLARAREIVSLTRSDFTKQFLIPMAASKGFSGAIREMATPYIDLAQETYSGVMSNLSESTKFLSDPQVKTATAESSFSMEELVTGKTTLYVVIPTERMDNQKTWLRLIIAAGMHVFKNPEKKRRRGHRCLFLIDEFAALGRIKELPTDISTMSGFGVDFALIVQGLGQLKDHYGDSRNEILDNCAYKWFCNVSDLDSAEYLSKTLGKATVETTSTSDSFSAGSNSSSRSSSTSRGETGRPLLTPDEVLNLGRDVAIAIQPGAHPHYLTPVDYWDLPTAFGALRQKYPSLYWDPPLAYDENPFFTEGEDKDGQERQERAKERARAGGNGGKRPERDAPMSMQKAREILEVGPGASRDEIHAAYRRLMLKVHPDVGGSNYFAKELNEAKDMLLDD